MNHLLRGASPLIAALVVAALSLAPTVVHAEGELKVGDAAPDFELPGSDGQTHRLADLRGRYVVVAFFPKAFTSG